MSPKKFKEILEDLENRRDKSVVNYNVDCFTIRANIKERLIETRLRDIFIYAKMTYPHIDYEIKNKIINGSRYKIYTLFL